MSIPGIVDKAAAGGKSTLNAFSGALGLVSGVLSLLALPFDILSQAFGATAGLLGGEVQSVNHQDQQPPTIETIETSQSNVQSNVMGGYARSKQIRLHSRQLKSKQSRKARSSHSKLSHKSTPHRSNHRSKQSRLKRTQSPRRSRSKGTIQRTRMNMSKRKTK
jgi:hypothetical protein